MGSTYFPDGKPLDARLRNKIYSETKWLNTSEHYYSSLPCIFNYVAMAGEDLYLLSTIYIETNVKHGASA